MWQMVVLAVLIVALMALVGLLVYVLYGLWITSQGAFFAPSSQERIQHILKLAQIEPGMKIADLGSGDGRVVQALAQAGAEVTGYEIDPWLVWQSRQRLRQAGLSQQTRILRQSFWQADLSEYDVIVIYGIDRIMPRLQEKIEADSQRNIKIISVYFQFPDWQPTQSLADVYLYSW